MQSIPEIPPREPHPFPTTPENPIELPNEIEPIEEPSTFEPPKGIKGYWD